MKKIAVIGLGFTGSAAIKRIKELKAEGFEVVQAKDLRENEMPFIEKIEIPMMDRIELTPKYFPRCKSKYHN